MILYPAIDLKDGNAVRLYKGDMDQATVFNDDPAAQAQAFVDAGCEWLHLVDLNGAELLTGTVENFSGFSTSDSTVATRAARQDAEERLSIMLADQIVTRLIASAPGLPG